MFQGDSISSEETVSIAGLLCSLMMTPCSDHLFEYLHTTDLVRHGCMRSGGQEAGGIGHALGKDDDSSDGSRVVRSEIKASNIVLNMVTPPRTCDSCSCSSGGRYTYESSMMKLSSSDVPGSISRSEQSGRSSKTKES